MAIEKKNSVAKSNSSSPPSLHPPYFQMIREAIATMKDRTGSSQPAIAKFIDDNYSRLLPPNFRKTISTQLKRLVKLEKLVKVKNSYKISAHEIPKTSSSKVETVDKAKKKMKRLSEIKTPEAMKRKTMGGKANAPPAKKSKKN